MCGRSCLSEREGEGQQGRGTMIPALNYELNNAQTASVCVCVRESERATKEVPKHFEQNTRQNWQIVLSILINFANYSSSNQITIQTWLSIGRIFNFHEYFWRFPQREHTLPCLNVVASFHVVRFEHNFCLNVKQFHTYTHIFAHTHTHASIHIHTLIPTHTHKALGWAAGKGRANLILLMKSLVEMTKRCPQR